MFIDALSGAISPSFLVDDSFASSIASAWNTLQEHGWVSAGLGGRLIADSTTPWHTTHVHISIGSRKVVNASSDDGCDSKHQFDKKYFGLELKICKIDPSSNTFRWMDASNQCGFVKDGLGNRIPDSSELVTHSEMLNNFGIGNQFKSLYSKWIYNIVRNVSKENTFNNIDGAIVKNVDTLNNETSFCKPYYNHSEDDGEVPFYKNYDGEIVSSYSLSNYKENYSNDCSSCESTCDVPGDIDFENNLQCVNVDSGCNKWISLENVLDCRNNLNLNYIGEGSNKFHCIALAGESTPKWIIDGQLKSGFMQCTNFEYPYDNIWGHFKYNATETTLESSRNVLGQWAEDDFRCDDLIEEYGLK